MSGWQIVVFAGIICATFTICFCFAMVALYLQEPTPLPGDPMVIHAEDLAWDEAEVKEPVPGWPVEPDEKIVDAERETLIKPPAEKVRSERRNQQVEG